MELVRIITNAAAYENDIAEEIRLFLGNVPMIFEAGEDAEDTIRIQLRKEQTRLIATAELAGANSRFEATLIGNSPLEQKRYEKRAVKIAVFRLLKKRYPMDMPWGSLTGIRPTKLFRELTAQNDLACARRTFLETFDVSPEKTALAEEVCNLQNPVIEGIGEREIDLYFGIPYCKTRCLYCSFGTELVKNSGTLERYLSALKRDIALSAAIVKEVGLRVRATYFGGGTPSILPPELINELLSTVVEHYGGLGRECTFEAGRPDTITAEKLSVIKDFGIDRISINPQTMNDETLKRIGRLHTAKDIERVFGLSRNLGFSHINMDLIIGLPGETREDVASSIARVLALDPENVTVHTLAIKRSSRLKSQLEQYPMVSAGEAEEMVRLCGEACKEKGLHPYYLYRQKYMQGNLENVGYSKAHERCLYNIDIMEELVSIMAHGAGAISKRVYPGGETRIERVPNPKDVPTYAEKIPQLARSKKALFIG